MGLSTIEPGRLTPVIAASFDGELSPLAWSSQTFLALIVVLLLVRVLAPWSHHGIARFAEEVCLILPAGLLYFLVRGLGRTDAALALANARDVIAVERSLGIFVEPTLQQAIADRPFLVNLFNWIYIWAHWPVILAWVIWMWCRHRGAYPLFRNAVLISGVAGMIVFALYPVAPPRLVDGLGLIDTVTLRSDSYRVLQPTALTNPFAAMPSLHFGWNLLVGIAIVRCAGNRWGRIIGFLLPVAMFSAIVLTANHYLLDGVAGALFALAGLAVSAYVTPRRSSTFEHLSLGRRLTGITRPRGAGTGLTESRT
jgi:hypothetical protein